MKAAAYAHAKTGASGVFIRLPATAVAAYKSAVTHTATGTSVITATGTPLDRFDIQLVITTGGTVGTSGAFYKLSINGGRSFTAPTALGTATSITVTGTGITLALAAGTLVALDAHTLYTLPASQTLLPQTVTRAASSTATLVATGAPEDEYEVALEILSGGTVGTSGITYRYSLDGGRMWSSTMALGVSTTILPLDGVEASGLTITVGVGTLDAGDKLAFGTTAPTWQASDAVTALAALRASALRWSFLCPVGTLDPGTAGALGSVLSGWASKTKFSWALGSIREWGASSNEPETNWTTRTIAAWSSYADTRIALCAGYARITCPITGRQNRRSCAVPAVARFIAIAPQIDLGQKEGGVLSSDVQIHGDGGGLEEHDADINGALHDARFITLRTWSDEAGVYFTSGNLMGPDTDIQLVQYRRVLNIAEEVYQRTMRETIKRGLAREPSTAKAPKIPGDVRAPDAARITQSVTNALRSQVTSQGMVSGISFTLNKTPISTGQGKWRLTGKVSINGLIYVDSTLGQIGFVDPALDAIFNNPAGA